MAFAPSQFHTLCRGLATRTFSRTAATRPIAAKNFSSSHTQWAEDNRTGDLGENKRHVVDKAKDKEPNLQAYESHAGQTSRAQGTGGHATEQADTNKGKEKAKKEFPEAPDTAIGFQDERGGKGH